jgi:hypothetical protein
MNQTTPDQIYITPYTGFTLFCIVWVCGSVCHAISQPLKVIYILMATIIGGVSKILHLTRRTRQRE